MRKDLPCTCEARRTINTARYVRKSTSYYVIIILLFIYVYIYIIIITDI
jgi:hypothetical protein